MKIGSRFRNSNNIEVDAMFTSIGIGAVSTDEEGNISRINDTALNILGMRSENLIGKWFHDVFIASDDNDNHIKPIHRPITRAIISGKSISERTFYKNSKGKNIPVFVTVSPLLVKGKPVGAVEVFRDITDEFEVDRLKSEFISIASHQLRTPATAVKNFLGLLREGYAGALTAEQSELIEQAYISNEHQLDIVNNLLYVARADSEQVNLRLLKHDLVELIRACVEEQIQVISNRNQILKMQLPPSLEAVFDKQFIHIMLENLVTNASKYTPDGGKIYITLKDKQTHYQVTVKDTGVGIAEEDIKKLFKRFSRIQNKLSTIRGGSGIGLYLTQRITELHQGTISVSSKKGKGTTFTVVLPKEL